MALRHWLQLSLTDGIGPILSRRLIELAGGIEAACEATPKLLARVEGIGLRKAEAIDQAMQEAARRVDDELAKAAALNVSIVCPDDSTYPVLMRSMTDPPSVLYVRGTLEPRDLNAIAIVGSRKCSFYGREQAERFGGLLAGAGYTVVSGGARGIDSAAHRGAISHPQGRTLAVLGCGVDIAYPPENEPFFKEIAKRGAVVSEYPLGTPPLADNFLRRNRIIAGLSRGVLVIEAAERSGALTTARRANEDYNRPVFALPGRVDNPLSQGPHQLIRDGAVLTTGIDDLIAGLDPLPADVIDQLPEQTTGAEPLSQPPATPAPSQAAPVSVQQQSILDAIGQDDANIDALVARTQLEPHIILRELTFLTLKGLVVRVEGQTFALRKR